MNKNMGTADRIIRVIIALFIATLYFTNTISGTLGLILLIFAAVFLATSLIGFCPIYKPFGFKTCSTKTQE